MGCAAGLTFRISPKAFRGNFRRGRRLSRSRSLAYRGGRGRRATLRAYFSASAQRQHLHLRCPAPGKKTVSFANGCRHTLPSGNSSGTGRIRAITTDLATIGQSIAIRWALAKAGRSCGSGAPCQRCIGRVGGIEETASYHTQCVFAVSPTQLAPSPQRCPEVGTNRRGTESGPVAP